MINLDELEALAKATGSFDADYEAGYWMGDDFCGLTDASNFIQAANPQAILELIADYKRLQFDVVNLLFRDKLAAQIIEPLALEGNPRARFWMAGFGRKIAIDEPSNYDDAIRTINNLSIELARLRTELAARTPPPAVAPYHRLDDIRQLPPPIINTRLESETIDEAWKYSQAGNAAETEAALIAEFPEYGEQLSICYFCGNQSDDLYLLPDGMFARLCTACASHHGAILAD